MFGFAMESSGFASYAAALALASLKKHLRYLGFVKDIALAGSTPDQIRPKELHLDVERIFYSGGGTNGTIQLKIMTVALWLLLIDEKGIEESAFHAREGFCLSQWEKLVLRDLYAATVNELEHIASGSLKRGGEDNGIHGWKHHFSKVFHSSARKY